MKLKALLPLTLVGSLVFAQPPAQQHYSYPERCATHYYIVEPVKLMPFLIRYHKELNLSEEQKEQIKKLIREIKRAIIPLDMEINRISKKVRHDMVFVDDENFVRAELNYLAALKVRRTMYNYKCIHSLKKILTKEQFEKLLNLAGIAK